MSVILGAGLCPAGSTGCGLGAMPQVNSSQARLFVKSDGTRGSTLYVNPTTLDRELDDRGIPRGNDSTPEKVRLALFTLKGSSALPDFGLDLLAMKTISANSARQAEVLVRKALEHLTKDRLISVQSVDVAVLSGRIDVSVRWVDLTTGKIQTSLLEP